MGVIIDDSLTFEAQISSVIRRCYATMGGLAKFSRAIPEEIKKMIIETLVFPHLSYCMTVWAGCGSTQKTQNSKDHQPLCADCQGIKAHRPCDTDVARVEMAEC